MDQSKIFGNTLPKIILLILCSRIYLLVGAKGIGPLGTLKKYTKRKKKASPQASEASAGWPQASEASAPR